MEVVGLGGHGRDRRLPSRRSGLIAGTRVGPPPARMRQPGGRNLAGPVLEMPPLVVVDPVEREAGAVVLQPLRAFARPDVQGGTADVRGVLRRQDTLPPGLREVQPMLLGGVPVPRGDAEERVVPPERLGPGGGERGERSGGQPGEVFGGEPQ